MPTGKRYYLTLSQKIKGPYSKRQVRSMYEAGKINDETNFLREDEGHWRKIDDSFFAELYAPSAAETPAAENAETPTQPRLKFDASDRAQLYAMGAIIVGFFLFGIILHLHQKAASAPAPQNSELTSVSNAVPKPSSSDKQGPVQTQAPSKVALVLSEMGVSADGHLSVKVTNHTPVALNLINISWIFFDDQGNQIGKGGPNEWVITCQAKDGSSTVVGPNETKVFTNPYASVASVFGPDLNKVASSQISVFLSRKDFEDLHLGSDFDSEDSTIRLVYQTPKFSLSMVNSPAPQSLAQTSPPTPQEAPTDTASDQSPAMETPVHWTLDSNGYTWKAATEEQRRTLCDAIARNDSSGNSGGFYYHALDSLYGDGSDEGVMKTKIDDVLPLFDKMQAAPSTESY